MIIMNEIKIAACSFVFKQTSEILLQEETSLN